MSENKIPLANKPITEKPLNKDKILLKKWGALAMLFLVLLIVAVVLIIGAVKKNSKESTTTGLEFDAEAIRNKFRPGPEYTVTEPNPVINTPATTTVAAFTPPRGGELNNQNPAISTSQPVTPQIYKNTTLGFSMDITNLWQATESGDGHTVAFVNAQGQNIFVQSYNITNETLSTVEAQLSGSDSVSDIKHSTFNGQPSLTFQTTNNTQGVAVIFGNKLFYIMAPTLTEPPVTTFLFL